MNKHFKVRWKIIDPEVIMPFPIANGGVTFRETTVPGKFFRVVPTTAYEVGFLTMLEHRREKFAPKISADTNRGEGVVISASAMAKIDA